MKKIVLFTAIFAMVLSGTAMAADWGFYGNARMALWSKNYDVDSGNNPFTNNDDFRTTEWTLQDNSRIGARISAGDIRGNFEMGWFGAPAGLAATSTKQAWRVRHLWGAWNFGGGEVLVGQTWTPTFFGISNQVANWDQGLYQFGSPALRAPQVTFIFSGFRIGLVDPRTTTATGYTNAVATLPKIDARWRGTFGPVSVHVGGGWQSTDMANATNQTVSVTSMLLNAYVKYAAGPFSIAGAGSYGINGNNYDGTTFGAVDASGNLVGTEFKDNTAYGLQLVAAFQVNDMVGLEGGWGYVTAEDDGAANSDDAQTFYLQVPLTLADGVVLTPEFTLFDYMENAAKAKEGQDTWIGAKFQISF